jgi:hypothetical protein
MKVLNFLGMRYGYMEKRIFKLDCFDTGSEILLLLLTDRGSETLKN